MHRIACPNWRHIAGVTTQGGSVVLFSVLSRGCSLGAHGLLRFRTNDVLLGTSGVGVCVSVVSNSPGIYYFYFLFFMLYRLPAGIPYHLLCLPRPGGRSASEWLPDRVCSDDPYNFFSPQAGPILLEVSPTIRSSVLRQSPGALSVFVTGESMALNHSASLST